MISQCTCHRRQHSSFCASCGGLDRSAFFFGRGAPVDLDDGGGPPTPISDEMFRAYATSDVLRERRAQLSKGYGADHDDRENGRLAVAAAAYALGSATIYPWHNVEDMLTCDRRTSYVRAAALLIAEIERLDRAEERAIPSGSGA